MIDKFARAFVRDREGAWFCRDVVHFIGPYGPACTTPGVTYVAGTKLRGQYDVAAWLESFAATGKTPLGIEFL